MSKGRFYFLCHGAVESLGDNPPLHQRGIYQAVAARALLTEHPITLIHASPRTATQQTAHHLSLKVPIVNVLNLAPCSPEVWEALQADSLTPAAIDFIERIRQTISAIQRQSGTALLISHKEVHWAICQLLHIAGHSWLSTPCLPVLFENTGTHWGAHLLGMRNE